MLKTETVGYYIEKLPWWLKDPLFGTLRSIVYAFRKDTYIALDTVFWADEELGVECKKLWKEINEFYADHIPGKNPYIKSYFQSYIGKTRHLKVDRKEDAIYGEMYGVDLNISEYVQALKSVHNYVVWEKKNLANAEAKRLGGINEARATLNLPKKETGQLSLPEGDSK
jgi:hypothetical protein